ncbi:hypothetical protein BaOVIS_000890 [Babesia ovis]|uniref:Uncharacterized protein n=1 Tax=Babesia ovis TaxID=5869 RepID=A0A9W5T897_BABOV|nr:hypothetical protein BaOVIS_000890 [Babesia ovis]
MKPTSLLQLALTIGSLTELIHALNLDKRIGLIYSGNHPQGITSRGLSNANSATGFFSERTSHGNQSVQKDLLCFIHHPERTTYSQGLSKSSHVSLYAKKKDVDDVFRTLCDSLKSKNTTFNDLQRRLESAGVTLEGCHRPEDVILRVAKLEVFGKEHVEDEIRKSNPQFQMIFNNILAANTTAYNSKNAKDRDDYISQMKDSLVSKEVTFDNNASDQEIITLTSELEARDLLSLQLPPTKPANEMSQRIDSYRDEANSIFAVYKNIKDEKTRNYFISQVKNELQSLSIDHNDCKKDEDYINRLAYGRVFPQEVKLTTSTNTLPDPSTDAHWDGVDVDGFDPFKAMLGMDGAQDLFGFNDGIFENSSGLSGIFGEDGAMGSGFSILKDIAKMFGVNLGGDKKSKIMFEEQDGTNVHATEDSMDNPTDSPEQPDDEMQHIFAKVRASGDQILQQMLTKCAKDPKLRNALKIAFEDGYDAARKSYVDDKSALYVLEKFHERGIF